MAGKCEKCDVEFKGNETVGKCLECLQTFHVTCTRLGLSQNFTKAKLKSWKCDSCHGDKASVSTVRSNEDPNLGSTQIILDAMSSMKTEINVHTDDKIVEVTASISALSDRFDKLESKLKTIEDGHEDLCKRCDDLEQDRDQLRYEVRELQQQFIDADQHSRCANLEITGLPTTEGEDVYEVLKKTASAIKVPYKRDDISIAHRLRLFSKRHKYSPIIVQFVSRTVREAWLTAARTKKGLKATEIAASLPTSEVYINEQLTRHNKVLLGYARNLLKQNKLHFAGYFNGKVMIKCSADPKAPSVRVFTVEDLDKYN